MKHSGTGNNQAPRSKLEERYGCFKHPGPGLPRLEKNVVDELFQMVGQFAAAPDKHDNLSLKPLTQHHALHRFLLRIQPQGPRRDQTDSEPQRYQVDDPIETFQQYSYVFRQPATPEELALAEEALLNCPSDSIGHDGETVSAAAQPNTEAPA
jgi:ferredoxin